MTSSAVTAYKFLARGATGPVTRVAWPAIGAWLGSPGPVSLCRSGIHACAREHLAYWLHEELWQVELDGELAAGPDCVIAPRARLVRQIDAWSPAGAQRFAAAVRDHAAALVGACRNEEERTFLAGYVADSSWHVTNAQPESPALAALCAAMAVAKLAELDFRRQPSDANTSAAEVLEQAYRRERTWQTNWIVEQMELT